MLRFLRLLGSLPMGVLHRLATLLYWLAFRIVRLRAEVTRRNLGKSFPELGDAAREALAGQYERAIADVAMEVVKGFAISREDIARRVLLEGLEAVRARLDAGQSVMLLTAHVCNWEWLLLALTAELGRPIDAVYKPMRNQCSERAFRWMRTRFGTRLVPARESIPRLLANRAETRVVALVADQSPTSSPIRYWTRFLNQDTAFYVGGEELARAASMPVYFVAMERRARGEYLARVQLLADVGADLARPREVTKRYAEALEAQVRRQPADWFWSHNRFKLKRPLYAR